MTLNLVRTVQELGFTEYEAKAYLALLDESPLSGYKVAQNSGVPQSKVYEVLGGLVRRGAVLVKHGDPVQYAPLAPKELISRRRKEMEASLETAEESLERYAESPDAGASSGTSRAGRRYWSEPARSPAARSGASWWRSGKRTRRS